LKIRFLQSKVNSEDRKQILEDFRAGELDCLVATSLADEGLDLPILDAVILAGSGMSKVKAMQRIGRAIRKFPGKEKAYIVDFMDKAHYLEKHSKERFEIYGEEKEFIIKIQKKV
jgi:superfamily II DNA or RNA helicase